MGQIGVDPYRLSSVLSIAFGFRRSIIPDSMKTQGNEQEGSCYRHCGHDGHDHTSYSIMIGIQLLIDVFVSDFMSNSSPHKVQTNNEQKANDMACEWLKTSSALSAFQIRQAIDLEPAACEHSIESSSPPKK